MQNKSQWARSCYNNSFDANICTTSRVESWNAVLKKYLNSHSKISDIIAFIEETEKTYLSKQLKISKDIYQLLEYDSLLKNLKVILPSRVYEKHIVQYNLGKRDYEKVRGLEEDGIPVFDVIFNGKPEENDNNIFINEILHKINTKLYWMTRLFAIAAFLSLQAWYAVMYSLFVHAKTSKT